MSTQDLVRRIKKKAKQDERNRHDRRFLETMGFLVAKGFLKANFEVLWSPNKRLRIDDALWAAVNVEPRILEVLPAAVLRLGRHFDLDPKVHKDLALVVDQLRKRQEKGATFRGIPYEKVKLWADFPLPDRRIKPVNKKKVMKTFRLDPIALRRLREAAAKKGCSETEMLEAMLLQAC